MTTTEGALAPHNSPLSAREGQGSTVAHIRADGAERALCGARLRGLAGSGKGKCAVCLDLAMAGRFASR